MCNSFTLTEKNSLQNEAGYSYIKLPKSFVRLVSVLRSIKEMFS